jgi:hypothetical protein
MQSPEFDNDVDHVQNQIDQRSIDLVDGTD